MKNIVATFIILYTTLPLVFAQNPDSLWVQANNAYSEGNYGESSEKYEAILAIGIESGDLYFNLGNAYYKQHMIGHSILNYERALKLNPENADVIYNLEMARLMQLDKIEEVPDFVLNKWYNQLLQIASANTWGIWSIVFFTSFLLLLMVYFFTRSYFLRKLSFFISVFAFFISIVCFSFAWQQRSILLDKSNAVIFAPVVTVKSSPDANGNDLFIIHEGLKVKIVDKIGTWNRIILSDGNQGWVPAETMEII